jgi:transposase
MRIKEKNLARQLRKQGLSLRSISQKIHCAKSTVSGWIRDIPLTNEQILNLKNSQDRGRAKAANHPNSPKLKWQTIRTRISTQAQQEIPTKAYESNLKTICAALYWAEGYKQTKNLFVFANTDPDMIRLMMYFLVNVCKVPKERFRGRVNIHPSLNVKNAEDYWSKISGISRKQFHKPLLLVSRSSQQKRKTLPYGTFRIIISDVILCSKMFGWIDALKLWGK